jgi:hypothetical protein
VSREFRQRERATLVSGDVLDVSFIATKAIGKWTIGPVGYYVGQVTNDTSSAFYHNAINVNSYNVWAAGGMVGYDFGPAQLNAWMVDEFSANASGPAGSITQGVKFFASLSYRLWAPDEPVVPKRPQFYSKSIHGLPSNFVDRRTMCAYFFVRVFVSTAAG